MPDSTICGKMYLIHCIPKGSGHSDCLLENKRNRYLSRHGELAKLLWCGVSMTEAAAAQLSLPEIMSGPQVHNITLQPRWIYNAYI